MTLPILRVKTAHSEYVIDQNAGTYTRTRVHEHANDLSAFGVEDAKPIQYRKIQSALEVGEPVIIIHHDGSWVRSTPIQSVEEVADAVAAE